MSLQKRIKDRLLKHFARFDLVKDKVAIISGHSSMNVFVQKICALLGVEKTDATIKKFKCDESYVCLNESVRHKHVYLFIPVIPDVNSRIMEMMFFVDALKAAEAEEINIILPCLPYARQDRRNDKREHVGTRVLSRMLDAIKGSTRTRVITLDLHSPQIESVYHDTHIEPLRVFQLNAIYINKIIKNYDKVTLGAPDFGGVKRLEQFVKETSLCKSDINVAFTHKRREAHNQCEVGHVVGDIDGRNVVMIDDILDTGGTLVKSAKAMKNYGAKNIDIFITHGHLNDPAISILADAQKEGIINSLTITDTIRLSDEKYEQVKSAGLKLQVIPTSILFAEVIGRIQRNMTLSPMYLNTEYLANLYKNIKPKQI